MGLQNCWKCWMRILMTPSLIAIGASVGSWSFERVLEHHVVLSFQPIPVQLWLSDPCFQQWEVQGKNSFSKKGVSIGPSSRHSWSLRRIQGFQRDGAHFGSKYSSTKGASESTLVLSWRTSMHRPSMQIWKVRKIYSLNSEGGSTHLLQHSHSGIKKSPSSVHWIQSW